MEFELQGEHEYALRVSADEFESLIEEHPDILLLDGEPRRQRGAEAQRAPYFAWRTGPDSFMVTTAGQAVDLGELDPPALTFNFEAREEGGAMVKVRGQQSLSAWDAVAQTTLQTSQSLVFWLERLRWWFSVSFFSGAIALGLAASLPAHFVSTFLAWSVFLVGQGLFVRYHLKNPRVDPARLAWHLEHKALARVTGELITPQLRGAGLDDGYRALGPSSE